MSGTYSSVILVLMRIDRVQRVLIDIAIILWKVKSIIIPYQ